MSRKTLGKYEIIERLGRGGMAEVYRGYHAALDRYVAIKLLHPFLADDPEFKDRFEKEAKNVAKLRHPNIVQVFDFEYDEKGESYYMVMELINGPTLKDKIFDLATNDQKFALPEAIRIVSEAGSALSYAHKRNMIHRDVKPANLMLDEDARLVLTDFGIAKIVTGAQFTASGGMVGTPAYMAPEQGLGEAGDERSDIYSLGVIFYQLLTNRLPFDADTPLAVILKHVNEPLPDLRQIEPEIPEWVVHMINRMMAKAPEDRFQNAEEFLEELKHGPYPINVAGTDTPTNALSTRELLALANEHHSTRRTSQVQGSVLDPSRKTGSIQIAGGSSVTPVIPTILETRPPSTANVGTNAPTVLDLEVAKPQEQADGESISWLAVIAVILIVFGLLGAGIVLGRDGQGPLASIFAPNDDNDGGNSVVAFNTETPTEAVTENATHEVTARSTMATPTRRFTRTPTPPTVTPSLTPSPTVPSLTPTFTPTYTESPTPTHTYIPSDTPTVTPTFNLTATARAATQAAATAVVEATLAARLQIIERCDLNYTVLSPVNVGRPPSRTNPNDASSRRLVRAETTFAFELEIENASTCPWFEEGGLELVFIPNTSTMTLTYDTQNCEDEERINMDVNFTDIKESVSVEIADSLARGGLTIIPILGTAPESFGCYFGAWQLRFTKYGIPVGPPIIIGIQVFGGI